MSWMLAGIMAMLTGSMLVAPVAAAEEHGTMQLTSFSSHGRLSGPPVEKDETPAEEIAAEVDATRYAPIGHLTAEDARRQARRLFAEEEQLEQLGVSAAAGE